MAGTVLVGSSTRSKPLSQNPHGVSPRGKFVVFQVRAEEQTTQGGLELPGGSGQRYRTPLADVIAVGPDVTGVKAGDVVMCADEIRLAPVFIGPDELFCVPEDRVIAVIANPPART